MSSAKAVVGGESCRLHEERRQARWNNTSFPSNTLHIYSEACYSWLAGDESLHLPLYRPDPVGRTAYVAVLPVAHADTCNRQRLTSPPGAH